MVFLLGEVGGTRLVEVLKAQGWGRMFTTKTPHIYPEEPFGFDNGAYRDFIHGRPMDESRFLRRLDLAYKVGKPALAVVPDIVCGGERSLEYSLRWIERLPQEWPWHLVLQNGQTLASIEAVLPMFAGLFLGGDNCFKNEALQWCALAHNHGKLFHYGRCGTSHKVRQALLIGADSADSNVRIWRPNELSRLSHLFSSYQQDMFGITNFIPLTNAA